MIRRPPRSTLFPYTTALPIWGRRRLRAPRGRGAADLRRPLRLPGAPPHPRPPGSRRGPCRGGLRADDGQGRRVPRDVGARGDQPRDRVAGRLHGLDPDRRVHRAEIGRAHRLNSSHLVISYAVFCLKQKKLRQWARGVTTRAWSLLELVTCSGPRLRPGTVSTAVTTVRISSPSSMACLSTPSLSSGT